VTAGPLGVGIDLVDVPRFAAVMARRPSMGERLFTERELAYARSLADPVPSLAARFAAKEAVMKALGVGLGAFPFPDVEVDRQASGQPHLLVTGRAAEVAAGRGAARWLVSLTHTSASAAAVVVALA
jgi:holo-[acyl-carrier protein] synthase